MKCPCKDCELRHEACWAHCDKYKEWRETFQAKKKNYDKEIAPANYISDQIQKRIKRFNKRK